MPLPVLFVSHGAPTFALEPGRAGALLADIGRRLPPVSAVLVLSPHWMSAGGVRVGHAAEPETLHDFGGFPHALYALRYPVPGHPVLAARTLTLLRQAGIPAEADPVRGLDHGAWVPLMHLLPQATVPVFQVSLPHPLDPAGALRLGQALAPLRDEGVLIVASGGMTHNLFEFRRHGDDAGYVGDFTRWVRTAVLAGDVPGLLDYRRLAPQAARAHPSEEHFLPLLVALGAGGSNAPVTVIDGGITDGVLSMESYLIGHGAEPAIAQEQRRST